MAEITAKMVKDLRAATGAGVLDCKKALVQSDGNFEAATDLLRKKGLAAAAKKADRATNEGIIGHYVHSGSKVAGMVIVGCETDFVARTDQFQKLARDLAMHIVASSPTYVARKDVPEDVRQRELAIYQEQAREGGKPEHIVERIVNGKLDKWYSQVCLLEQEFVKEPDQTIQDLLVNNIASLGENIQITGFSRLEVGS